VKNNWWALTVENYRFFNWAGTPPDEMSAEEAAELPPGITAQTSHDAHRERSPSTEESSPLEGPAVVEEEVRGWQRHRERQRRPVKLPPR